MAYGASPRFAHHAPGTSHGRGRPGVSQLTAARRGAWIQSAYDNFRNSLRSNLTIPYSVLGWESCISRPKILRVRQSNLPRFYGSVHTIPRRIVISDKPMQL